MAFCLTKDFTDKFLKGLRSGDINPEKLSEMSSEERRGYLAKFVGEENGKQVNALFESKLLLKDKQQGMINWAKRVGGITVEARRDIISRVQRMDKILNPEDEKQFLHDLASTRLGVDVTQAEAKNIVDLSKNIEEAKLKISDSMPLRSPERMQYGLAKELLKNYIGKLKADAQKIKFSEQKVKYITNIVWKTIPDLAQTLQTSYDNSIWGRQLITTLFNPRYSSIWTKNFLRSWKDIGNALMGGDPIIAVKADINSRPNALNGKYAADPQGYGLGIDSEEVYSVHFPARIPVLGRLFNASEAAFNGGALRVRADLADLHIRAAESAGKNVLDKKFAAGLGNFVTAITGRAAIRGEGIARSLLYAPRMYLADIHQLTSHLLDPRADSYVKKEAAKNLALTLGAYSLLFTTAKMIDPSSVDLDKHLGQIKIFGAWIDFTGGRASFVNLAVKMSEKVYGYMQGKVPKYGEPTARDLLFDFASNKAAPKASVLLDILRGSMYGGQKITLQNELLSRLTPLTGQDTNNILNDPKATNGLALSIINGLGASVRTQNQFKKDWSQNPTQAQQAFLGEVGQDKFNKANDDFNKAYNAWLDKTSTTAQYKSLSDEAKQALATSAKAEIQKSIFGNYGFKYKETKAAKNQKQAESKAIKNLLPQ